MSAFTHPKDIFPWRGLNTGAKVVNYFGLCKKNAVLGRFFVWRVGNYFRNVVNRFRKGVNFFRN